MFSRILGIYYILIITFTVIVNCQTSCEQGCIDMFRSCGSSDTCRCNYILCYSSCCFQGRGGPGCSTSKC